VWIIDDHFTRSLGTGGFAFAVALPDAEQRVSSQSHRRDPKLQS
jgi:hypothetical protein